MWIDRALMRFVFFVQTPAHLSTVSERCLSALKTFTMRDPDAALRMCVCMFATQEERVRFIMYIMILEIICIILNYHLWLLKSGLI